MKALDLDINKRYTYADYLNWMDEKRRELINGFIKLMTPSPSRKHQEISFHLSGILRSYLVQKNCKGFTAPSDVRLPEGNKSHYNKDIYTVVQPDIYVVCDLSKLDDKGCLGAPDFIIEIVSPDQVQRDVKEKFELYERHGVKEYWIVNPNDENVNVFVLDNKGKYQFQGIFAGDDKIPVHIFDGDMAVDLTEVFIEQKKE
ncbi:MAG: Uma2 family endonuclease [Bacteroidales bacterium]|nr:Uma2 family endonuclease [Bacteroidales bacterium]MCF8333590.1 Uma2 family endonuclease [Bacteroidales bacterium]